MLAHKKEDKHLEKDKDLSNKQESKSGKSESSTSPPPMKGDRKHGSRFTSPMYYTIICWPFYFCVLLSFTVDIILFFFRGQEPRQDDANKY